MPENDPQRDEKESIENEMMRKKRRFDRGLGYMGEMNEDCGNVKLKEKKNEDISSSKSERMS